MSFFLFSIWGNGIVNSTEFNYAGLEDSTEIVEGNLVWNFVVSLQLLVGVSGGCGLRVSSPSGPVFDRYQRVASEIPKMGIDCIQCTP